MAKDLIINASLPEVRIALMEKGQIQELLIERQSDKGIVGNIYKGRVTRVLPGMQAAFVDIGLEKAAFLYVDDIYVHPQVMGDDSDVESDVEMDSDEPQGDSDLREENGGSEFSASSLRGESPNENQDENQNDDQGGFESSDESSDQSSDLKPSVEGQSVAPARGGFIVQASASATTITEGANPESTTEGGIDSVAAAEGTANPTLMSDSAIEARYENETFSDEGSESDEDEDDFDDEGGEDSLEDDSSEDGEEGENFESDQASFDSASSAEGQEATSAEGTSSENQDLQGLSRTGDKAGGRKRFRNRNRRRRGRGDRKPQFPQSTDGQNDFVPEGVQQFEADGGDVGSDRAGLSADGAVGQTRGQFKPRKEFREQRNRDRRIKSKSTKPRATANIADLLKEGQEVIVQAAKDPIATKGARLTCHVSLPGRHLVCMPTIDHVGVSRRIEREDERRKLRDFVERNRPKKMGFIVRTASGGKDPESWIKQDIDYLSKTWKQIRERADTSPAPALVYEDLNSVLRAIRDWVNEDIGRIVVDSRFYYNELEQFAERFMPSLLDKLELYQGDLPIFDTHGISSEIHRALERKVWLKSGGYIVIDQAEALVAIDVNTGRFVGKKNLEDTILKTNLEAVEEIAYQLRLRNCGGMIIVDFIDMEREDNRMRVYRAMDEALKKDRARPTIQKISELGLVEMTRKRTRDTIVRSLCEPCTHCEGKGYTKTSVTVAYEVLREIERLCVDRDSKKILVSSHEAVIDLLAIDFRETLDQIERRYHKSIYLQSVLDFHREQFEVVTDRNPNKKSNQDVARQLRMERERSERREKQKNFRKERTPQIEHQEDSRNNEESYVTQERESSRSEVEEKAPVKRPEGSFIIQARPAQVVSTDAGNVSNESADLNSNENEFAGSTANQASMGNSVPSPSVASSGTAFEDMDDEDQLAYLRAQAAQDAAINNFGTGSTGYGNASPSRPQNQRFQGQNRHQNHKGRGGRDQKSRHGQQRGFQNRGGGQGHSFRPRQPGPEQQPQAPVQSFAAPENVVVPDYEVLSRNSGNGNENG